ncbi:MAG: ligase-associated DNA damage response endonuclease PdeM [Hyphomonadaceae bacterium]
MPMLSDFQRRASARARRLSAPPAVTAAGAGAQLRVAGVPIEALACGALWLARSRTLVVSDLHLEKGSSFARGGQMLPPYDTRATLARLAETMRAMAPRRVVSLGDSFHDGDGPARLDGEDRARLAALIAAAEWIWIEGNHDGAAPASLGGAVREEIVIDGLILRHAPRVGALSGEIAGHLHPCAKVAARGRAVRARCFATDGARLVMPAYGAYAGGLNLRDEAFDPLFPSGALALMIARARVWPAPAERLLPDA